MTSINKRYRLHLVALLLCLIQVAGMDMYAQEPIRVPADSIRTAPKAHSRRSREAINRLPTAAENLKDAAVEQKRVDEAIQLLDSAATTLLHTTVADSLEGVNKQNLEQVFTHTTPVVPDIPKDSLSQVIPKRLFIPNPTKATWLAMVFPGAGQIYNRKYWKLPIIYGGFAGCAYALSWNGKMYKDYSQAYMDIMDDNPNTTSYLDLIPPNANYNENQLKELLRKRKDTFRRYRDLSIFAFIGVYLISVIDAYVDAELSNFDISPDLSMRVEPTIMTNQYHTGSKAVGVQCSFRF